MKATATTIPQSPKNRNWPALVLSVAILVYSLYFSFYQIARHNALWTFIDLAALEQPIWNTLQGRWMHYTIYPATNEVIQDFTDRITENRLGTHVQPILLLLALPYALIPRPETLLITMCIVVGLGAWPLYHIVKRRLHSETWSVLFALAYLLLPAIQTASGWDLHGTSLLPTLLLFSFDAAERQKTGGWWLWALLAMGCREDIPFLVGWGMFFMVPKELRRQAALMLGIGFLLSCLNFFVIIPYFSGGQTPYLSFFVPPGSGGNGSLLTTLLDFDFWRTKILTFVIYNFRLGIPLLGLYYLHWPTLLAIAPTLVINSLSHNTATINPAYSHYSLPLISWVLIGTLEGVRIANRQLMRLNSRLAWRATLSAGVCVTVLATHFVEGYTPLNQNFVWPQPAPQRATAQHLAQRIPHNAPASFDMHLATHNAQRETLRIFPDLRGVEWILINVWRGGYPYGVTEGLWEDLFSDPTWETVAAHNGFLLLKKGHGPPQNIRDAFIPLASTPTFNVQFSHPHADLHLYDAQAIPLPLGNFYLCTHWEYKSSTAINIKVAVADPQVRGHKPLEAAVIYPPLLQQPGTFRDCTRLPKDPRSREVHIRFLIHTATDNQPLTATLIDTGTTPHPLTIENNTLTLTLTDWE